VDSSRRTARRAQVVGGVLALLGLGVLFVVIGLDRSDKYASIIGAFVGLAGLGIAVRGTAQARNKATETESQGELEGIFSIVNHACGLALTAADGSTPGCPVSARTFVASPQQRWRVERTKRAGEFMLLSDASGLALDSTKATPGGEHLLCQAAFGGSGQRWHIAPSENGNFTIRSVSGHVEYLSLNSRAEDGWRPWFKSSVETVGQRWHFGRVR